MKSYCGDGAVYVFVVFRFEVVAFFFLFFFTVGGSLLLHTLVFNGIEPCKACLPESAGKKIAYTVIVPCITRSP